MLIRLTCGKFLLFHLSVVTLALANLSVCKELAVETEHNTQIITDIKLLYTSYSYS